MNPKESSKREKKIQKHLRNIGLCKEPDPTCQEHGPKPMLLAWALGCPMHGRYAVCSYNALGVYVIPSAP